MSAFATTAKRVMRRTERRVFISEDDVARFRAKKQPRIFYFAIFWFIREVSALG